MNKIKIKKTKQNWRSGQNRFCLEVRRLEVEVQGEGGKGGPNNVYTYE
jgi:hypothetical protein